ncbi:MAG TPA: OBAP family protein [Geopsychrobacteraceae bacterium]
MKTLLIIVLLNVAALVGCTEQQRSGPPVEEAGTLLESPPPLQALGVYLDGLHFRNGRPGEQMDVHHYCGALNEDLIQCVLFDGNGQDAHMVGIEYVVSAALFESLSAEERALWHSHRYEVKSGQLVAPGMPEPAEHELMAQLISTYGKTWHTWADDPILPLGAPALMMGFTADGQVRPELVEQRDRTLGVSTAAKQAARADIAETPILPGADAWQSGNVVQVKLERE